jgi:ABC-type iron transport system FetAB ATPase subunit
VSTLHFTTEEQEAYEKKNREIHFHSSLGFLNAHNGLRRGALHLAMATTGAGKSTLVRTLVRDVLFHPKNDISVGVWLSEESTDDYKAQIAYGIPSHPRLEKAYILSELEVKQNKKLAFIEWIKFYLPDVVIFDNVTTSYFYNDKTAKEQGEFILLLKELAIEHNFALVIIAHTDAKATDTMGRLINLNDIRGSKNLPNLVEFAYILQRFEIGTSYFSTIRVEKSRSQELVHKLYQLHYEPRLRSFRGDTAIEFASFKEMYGKRNKLDK